jgi:hypothetical protein
VQHETLRKVWKIHHHLMGPAVVNGSMRMTIGLRTTGTSVVTVGMCTGTLNYALGLCDANPELP